MLDMIARVLVSDVTLLSFGVYSRRVDRFDDRAERRDEAERGVCSAPPSFALLLSLLPPLEPRVKECNADDGRLLPVV